MNNIKLVIIRTLKNMIGSIGNIFCYDKIKVNMLSTATNLC